MSATLLLSRAQTALFNPQEVTQALCEVAWGEALELTYSKPIPVTMLLDVAFMRLKLHLKVEVDEIESKLAFMAIKEADRTSVTVDSNGVVSALDTGVKTSKRVSEWDM